MEQTDRGVGVNSSTELSDSLVQLADHFPSTYGASILFLTFCECHYRGFQRELKSTRVWNPLIFRMYDKFRLDAPRKAINEINDVDHGGFDNLWITNICEINKWLSPKDVSQFTVTLLF